MAATTTTPAAEGLTAQQLADFRETIGTELSTARAKAAGPVPANAVCGREFNHGLEIAYDFALTLLDELLTEVGTFVLTEPDASQTAD